MTTDLPNFAPSLNDLDTLAYAAWNELPGEFKRFAGDILFRIEDVADHETLRELGIDDPLELSGLYQGVDLTERSITDPTPSTPMVFLYRRAILGEWIERGDVTLKELVAHVLVHEVGHHFGFSDNQMDAIFRGED